jgi:hypothetical protein
MNVYYLSCDGDPTCEVEAMRRLDPQLSITRISPVLYFVQADTLSADMIIRMARSCLPPDAAVVLVPAATPIGGDVPSGTLQMISLAVHRAEEES